MAGKKRNMTPAQETEMLQRTLDLNEVIGQAKAAKEMGVPTSTFQHRVMRAKREGFKPRTEVKKEAWQEERIKLKDTVRRLRLDLNSTQRENVSAALIRNKIIGIMDKEVDIPDWMVEFDDPDAVGVPMLDLSDLHWGEVVSPEQVNHVNKYNLDIAQKRLRRVISKTIDLCFNHQVRTDYPGIVLVLGGDLLNGDIHDNDKYNEKPLMVTFLDLQGCLIWAINQLADSFGKVFIPAVPGNHARNTVKPTYKDRNYTNFEWLLACLLEKHFEDDDRVTFLVADGPDAYFSIYNTRFNVTHGDAMGARGGDGIIGAVGPIIRGDVKVRSLNEQMNMPYDILIAHHWHQARHLGKVICNGSLIGYNEYAMLQLRAGYELPSQNLLFIHPLYGNTQWWKIFAEAPRTVKKSKKWISWKE